MFLVKLTANQIEAAGRMPYAGEEFVNAGLRRKELVTAVIPIYENGSAE